MTNKGKVIIIIDIKIIKGGETMKRRLIAILCAFVLAVPANTYTVFASENMFADNVAMVEEKTEEGQEVNTAAMLDVAHRK